MPRSFTKLASTPHGERNAISGYRPQYEEFARCVYDTLVDGSLIEIRVADNDDNVGKLDDIIYVTTNEVHAFQVKWSNTSKALTLGDFKTLLPAIVQGWKKIQALYPDKKVVPHLLTNRPCSSQFDISNNETLVQLKKTSKLSCKEWKLFWNAFVFTTGYIPERFDVVNRIANQRTADVRDLVSFIVDKVAGKEQEIVVSRQQIIDGLKWSSRFESHYNHNLVVSETTYQPNEKALNQIETLLKSKNKGYIFLKGTPGSGKSTLLTQWVRTIPNKSVRYYAFDFTDPSSQRYNDSQRGEHVTFLYDMVHEMEKAGFGHSNTLLYKDYDFLKSRFYDLLKSMSDEFQKTRLSVVIVVDGLDHITREYDVANRSLMKVLPSLSDLPEGVVFVLGSQYFDGLGLHVSIEKEAKNGDSLVEMGPFSNTEVENLAVKILGKEKATDEVLAQCLSKSQGHPLYLHYILNEIQEKGAAAFDTMSDYTEDVESYYDRIVGSLLDNVQLKHFLGLLSRVTGHVLIEDIHKWGIDEQVLAEFRSRMWHLFNHGTDNRTLAFFHNSFRQYLLSKTAEDVLTGQFSHKDDKNYYKELASLYANRWTEGYYLYHAEDYEGFITKLTPDALYVQAQNFRPIWSLQKDLDFAIAIAKKKKDPYLLVRYMLFEAQLSQMENTDYSSLLLAEQFIGMGNEFLAKEIIREGNKLHCNRSVGLELSKKFQQSGDQAEAVALFDLAYPDYVSKRIYGPSFHHNGFNDELKALKSWVNIAAYFLPWAKVNDNIEVFVDYLKRLAAQEKKHIKVNNIRETFRIEYAESLVEQGRWDELDVFLKPLLGRKSQTMSNYMVLRDAVLKLVGVGNDDRVADYYEKLVNAHAQLPTTALRGLEMAFVSSEIKNTGVQPVSNYLKQVSWSELGSYYLSEVRAPFEDLRPHIVYVRLRALLGFDDKILDFVPDDLSDADNPYMEQYVRRLLYLAKLEGKALKGDVVTTDFIKVIDGYLRYFDRLSLASHHKFIYTIASQRAEFYQYLIEVASTCDTESLETLAEKMEDYFVEIGCGADADSKRKAVMALLENGFDKVRCASMLSQIETSMMDDKDLYGRAEEAYLQGKAWITLGEAEKAYRCFRQMILESFGVGYRKDYQPSVFVEWIDLINKNNPEAAVARFHWITSRLRYIQDVSEGRTAVRAGEELLSSALKYNLGTGIKLARWLLDQEFGYFQSVSEIIIRQLLDKVNTQEEYSFLFAYYTQIHLFYDDKGYEANTDLLSAIVKKGMALWEDDFGKIKAVLQNYIKVQCPENIVDSMLEELEQCCGIKTNEGKEEHRRKYQQKLDEVEKLLCSGEKTKAWDLTLETIKTSSPSGWVRFYDGGSRIDSCKTLQKIDKERGRVFTIELFADEIKGGFNYGSMQYLDEIMPLLTDKIDHQRLFEEELSYMNRILRENTIDMNDVPDIDPDESLIVDALIDWLIYLAGMPVICLSDSAMILLAHFVDEGKTEVVAKIDEELHSERKILELGMYLKEMESPNLAVVKDWALKGAVSVNYQYRIYSKNILDSLGVPIPEPASRALSPIYNLSFTEKPKLDLEDSDQELGDVRDWNDASNVMAIAVFVSRYLAYVSNLSQKTLEMRAFELMKKHGFNTEDIVQEDKKIHSHFKNIGLLHPYIRVHAQPALDGMFEVATELLDSGVIRSKYLDDVFITYDFGVINHKTYLKPDFIQRIAEVGSWTVSDAWDINVSNTPRFDDQLNKYEGMYVIGEYTRLIKREDKVPVEEYLSKVSFDNRKDNEYGFFGNSALQKLTADYLMLGDDDPQIIIVRDGHFSVSTLKHHWIAINPAFSFDLGWFPSNDGDFAWNDKNGNRMVESKYWQSGNMNGRDRSKYETSEGWLVLASRGALETIKSNSQTYLHKFIQRGYHLHSYEFSHSDNKIYTL